MSLLVKKGYSLFAYVDGNSGYKGVYNKEQSVEMAFLNSTISTRTGLAKIAFFAKIPIVPFVAYYQDHVPKMTLLPPIEVKKSDRVEVFTLKTTQYLYSQFQRYIKIYYDQWESWFYLHKYLPNELLNQTGKQFQRQSRSSGN